MLWLKIVKLAEILETDVSDNWSMHVGLIGENLTYVSYYYIDLYTKKKCQMKQRRTSETEVKVLGPLSMSNFTQYPKITGYITPMRLKITL